MKFEFSPHIAVQVKDYEVAVAFYKNVLGMEMVYHDPSEAEFKCGKVHFHVENSDLGHTFFEFRVDDLAAAVQTLTDKGCDAVETTTPEGARSYLITDPFGLRFHLFED